MISFISRNQNTAADSTIWQTRFPSRDMLRSTFIDLFVVSSWGLLFPLCHRAWFALSLISSRGKETFSLVKKPTSVVLKF